MGKDNANIEETNRALDDLRGMRERWDRILSQLDIFYTRDPDQKVFPKTQEWAMEQLEKITLTEGILTQHKARLEST